MGVSTMLQHRIGKHWGTTIHSWPLLYVVHASHGKKGTKAAHWWGRIREAS
jgi:hypothetical protein